MTSLQEKIEFIVANENSFDFLKGIVGLLDELAKEYLSTIEVIEKKTDMNKRELDKRRDDDLKKLWSDNEADKNTLKDLKDNRLKVIDDCCKTYNQSKYWIMRSDIKDWVHRHLNDTDIAVYDEYINEAASISVMPDVTALKSEIEEEFNKLTKIRFDSYEEKKNAITSSYNEKRKKADQDGKSEKAKKEEHFQAELKVLFDSEVLLAKFDELMQERLLFEKYDGNNPSKLPEHYDLGYIALPIPQDYQNDGFLCESIISFLSEWKEKGVATEKNGIWNIRIPYIVPRREGFALALPKLDQKELTSMILRNIMNFKAGKCKITVMSAEVSGVFRQLQALKNELKNKVIFNKVDKDDIEITMKESWKLVQELVEGYRNDEERERVKDFAILLIYGFPNGFTDKAVEMLNGILSANRVGVNIILCHDESDYSIDSINEHKLKQAKKIIKKMTAVIGNKTDSMYIKHNDCSYIYTLGEIIEDEESDKIIDKIAEHLGDEDDIKYDFENIFRDWKDGDSYFRGGTAIEGINALIGFSSETKVELILGHGGRDDRHHVIIQAGTGGGKSEFLHSIILSLLCKYKEDALNLYLLDYKLGTEFNVYNEEYQINAVKYILEDRNRTSGRELLEKLENERIRRSNLINSSKFTYRDYETYRKITGEVMPRIVVIIDEATVLLQNDEIGRRCWDILKSISMQGRAAGIHLILCAQNFEGSLVQDSNLDNFKWRFFLHGKSTGDYTDKAGETLKPERMSDFDSVYVSGHLREVIKKISENQGNAITDNINIPDSKLYSSRVEHHKKFALNTFNPEDPTECVLFVGEGRNETVKILLSEQVNSLLVICPEEKRVDRNSISCDIINYIVASLLMYGVNNFDLRDVGDYISLCAIEINPLYIEQLNKIYEIFEDEEFSKPLQYILVDENNDAKYDEGIEHARGIISRFYDEYCKRKKHIEDKTLPKYLILYGLERLVSLKEESGDANEDDANVESGITFYQKIQELIRNGNEANMFVIAWTFDYEMAGSDFGIADITGLFKSVLASEMGESMGKLVRYKGELTDAGNVAVYRRANRTKNGMINLFQTPSDEWLDSFADMYYKKLCEADWEGEIN